MRKKREGLAILTATFFLILLLSGAGEAVQENIRAKVLVNTGKLLITNSQGERTIQGEMSDDLLLAPQTTLISLDGMCVVKVHDMQLILDAGDSLRCEAQENLQFTCLNGSIEAISGEKTFKLAKGEVIALAEGGEIFQQRARDLRQSPGMVTVGTPRTDGPAELPQHQSGVYGPNPKSQWTSPYF
ncbi:MAG: hypothetical protein ACMUIA_10060 [bacterium]